MANSIKTVAGSLALQVTKPARAAGLVEDTREDDVRLADVKVASVDHTILVFDTDTDPRDRIELYRVAVRDAESQHRIADATMRPKGNGYMVALPGAREAGFEDGDLAPVRSAPGLLVITPDEHRYLRRAEDLEGSWCDIVGC